MTVWRDACLCPAYGSGVLLRWPSKAGPAAGACSRQEWARGLSLGVTLMPLSARQVRKHGSARKYPAEVLAVGHEVGG